MGGLNVKKKEKMSLKKQLVLYYRRRVRLFCSEASFACHLKTANSRLESIGI